MSTLVADYLPLMRKFKNLKPSEKRKLICEDEKFIQCMAGVCLNLVKGNVPLNRPQKVKLRRHRSIIKKLAGNVRKLKNKKKLLQKGGGVFLPLLFSVIAPLINKWFAQ